MNAQAQKYRKPNFFIGNMDEKTAKRLFLFLEDDFGGIGFDEAAAQEQVDIYRKYNISTKGLECLSGKWVVDVAAILKLFPQLKLDYKEYSAIIDTAVLEEVCHTVGFKHSEREEYYATAEIFFDLAFKSYE